MEFKKADLLKRFLASFAIPNVFMVRTGESLRVDTGCLVGFAYGNNIAY